MNILKAERKNKLSFHLDEEEVKLVVLKLCINTPSHIPGIFGLTYFAIFRQREIFLPDHLDWTSYI